ncbi:MAG: TspO/MBR family protein [Patescibacteria group bacterium]|nr:MAG: TspO/MBR family protein [Patescibacteria group bacterium]
MKPNYAIIPLVTVLTAVLGSRFTSSGLGSWYSTINLPSWTPPGGVIGLVWTTIFTLTAISALILWNTPSARLKLPTFAAVFLLNAALNVFWSYLFFSRHQIGAAVWEAIVLDLTVIVLIVLAWPISRLAAALLVPYAAWVAFASYLTYSVWKLNP